MQLRVLAVLLLIPAGSYAQQTPPAPAPPAPTSRPPGCTAAEHRQFDFWIGEWQVTDSARTRTMGSSIITAEESGCMLRERWTGGGGTGQSMNFYDRRNGQWHQVWVASGGGVLRLSGGLDGTSMVLEGEGVSPTGAPVRNRIAWTPQPDGRVRQLWSTSSDGGNTWRPGFDGWYARRSP